MSGECVAAVIVPEGVGSGWALGSAPRVRITLMRPLSWTTPPLGPVLPIIRRSFARALGLWASITRLTWHCGAHGSEPGSATGSSAAVKTIMQWCSRLGSFWRQTIRRRPSSASVPEPVTASELPASTSWAPTTGL